MKTLKYQDEQEWLDARVGKITGTRVKDIIPKRGTAKKDGFYELIAERIAVQPDDENPMERGRRLESEAMDLFVKETGKKVDRDLILWVSEENEDIALSPDGPIGQTEAVEVKCLSSAKHIKAFLTQEVPSEHVDQTIHYFLVNKKLKTLYVAFYDPRIPVKPFFVIEIKREDVQETVDKYEAYLKETLKEVSEIVNELTF